jgi:mannose/cellobiose epimerase-like protein (N-acyl-D-glucosamine 2-epimerase family)
LSVRSGAARLWPQTERLKAALAFDDIGGALEAARALRGYLDDAPPGLWRENQDAAGRYMQQAAPASSFYHVIGALAELAVWRAART